jgi:hypothetical protein
MSKAKFNLEKKDIKKKINSGQKVKNIAKEYGCSVGLIYTFCKNNNIKIPKLDLVGHQFNKLKVIKKIGSKNGSIYWLCECECGKLREFPTKSINRKENISCGCYLYSKERSRKNKFWNGYEDIHGKWWGNIRKGAAKRSHQFNISIKYAWKLFLKQEKKCSLSGVDIKFSRSSRGFQRGETTASLDRIDNSKGYIKGNVQWLHKNVNLMKQKMSQDELIGWCKLIVDYRKNNHEIQT